MIIEIKKFGSVNELIKALENELGSEGRFMLMLRQNWGELFGTESKTSLASEVSEVIRFVDGNSEIFSVKVVYKPGAGTMSEFINNVASYIQSKAALIRVTIERLKSLSDEERSRPATALLVDSIPIMIILQQQ